jgi:DNA-binding transcriptional LysR family regulator
VHPPRYRVTLRYGAACKTAQKKSQDIGYVQHRASYKAEFRNGASIESSESRMPFSRFDLADLVYFLAIARHQSFRRAGQELGVSASALSHAIRRLESHLGVRLLNRTSRSVSLTAAGEQLAAAIVEPFATIGDAIENLNRLRDAPTGRIRINAPDDAACLLLAPILPAFAEHFPEMEIEIAVDNHLVDVVGQGFDAGIRYGGTVPEDMIALRVSADIRWVVACSRSYVERYGTPQYRRPGRSDAQQH